MDATTFAVMRLAEHRFADLERENRRRVAHAERRAALAEAKHRTALAEAERRVSPTERRAHPPTADAPETSEAAARTSSNGLALAGPSS